MEKKIIDLEDANSAFQNLDEKLNVLRSGFYALSADYGYYIENTFGVEHKIFELRDNVVYRFFSSVFHYQLLHRQQHVIKHKLDEIMTKTPEALTRFIIPDNPHFKYAEKEMSSIVDSIVFHLASIYDYLSILINFTLVKDRDKHLKWTSLKKIARSADNEIGRSKISKIIEEIDRDFVATLYDYRSDLIHTMTDINSYSVEIRSLDKIEIRFLCSTRLRKYFKKMGEKENDYTLQYFVDWLINETIHTIAKLIYGLRTEIRNDTKFYKNLMSIRGDRPFLTGITNDNIMTSPARWGEFDHFFEHLNPDSPTQ